MPFSIFQGSFLCFSVKQWRGGCAVESGCEMARTVTIKGRSIFKGGVPDDLDLV